MNFRETMEYIGQAGQYGISPGLENIRELCRRLGDPQKGLKFVHVAGTNGKGSVSAFVASVLKCGGYRVGRYLSPALFDYREIIQVNGREISKKALCSGMDLVREVCDGMTAEGMPHPTLFEMETALGFWYFREKECDIVVLETGMGGLLDATNVVEDTCAAVLTSISMDHMKFLGNSIEEIARQKAGIIKENSFAAAVRPRQEQVRKVLEEICQKKHTELVYAEKEKAEDVHVESGVSFDKEKEQTEDRAQNFLCFSYGDYGKLRLSMTGAYQTENSICAIKAIELLRKQGWKITNEQVKKGLEQARWEGRFSRLCREPLVVMDGAHNEDAAKKLRETLKMGFTNYKIIYIIGVLADKEYDKILKIMTPLAWKVFTVTPNHPRAFDGALLAERAEAYHSDVRFCGTVSEGLEQAFACAKSKTAGEKAMILAFGSLSYLGEIREIVRRNRL